MKKIIPVLLIIIIVILLAVIGCGTFFAINMKNDYDEKISELDEKILNQNKQEENQLDDKIDINNTKTTESEKSVTNTKNNNEKTEVQNNQEEKNVDSTKDIVTELYSESIKKEDMVFKYRFPKININSVYAEESNIEIENQKKLAQKAIDTLNNSAEPMLPDYYSLTDYKYYTKDNILTVVMYGYHDWGGDEIINVYNIDMQTGNKLEKTDLLKKVNIAENEFQEKIYKIVKDKKEFYQFDIYPLTKKESCTLEMCKIFYSDNGHVFVAVPVDGTDETGHYYIDLNTNDVFTAVENIK